MQREAVDGQPDFGFAPALASPVHKFAVDVFAVDVSKVCPAYARSGDVDL